MNIEALAQTAAEHIDLLDFDFGLQTSHGIEISPGWFVIYNMLTGQSKSVVWHEESDFIFKPDYATVPAHASGRYLGDVNFDGTFYRVRLPKFYVFPVGTSEYEFITAQEYVRGSACDCASSWCSHSRTLARATGCEDAHNGNWKIVGDEIVLFDYEGIEL